jgi:hypothetical protein
MRDFPAIEVGLSGLAQMGRPGLFLRALALGLTGVSPLAAVLAFILMGRGDAPWAPFVGFAAVAILGFGGAYLWLSLQAQIYQMILGSLPEVKSGANKSAGTRLYRSRMGFAPIFFLAVGIGGAMAAAAVVMSQKWPAPWHGLAPLLAVIPALIGLGYVAARMSLMTVIAMAEPDVLDKVGGMASRSWALTRNAPGGVAMAWVVAWLVWTVLSAALAGGAAWLVWRNGLWRAAAEAASSRGWVPAEMPLEWLPGVVVAVAVLVLLGGFAVASHAVVEATAYKLLKSD